jgi:hypothetical protein
MPTADNPSYAHMFGEPKTDRELFLLMNARLTLTVDNLDARLITNTATIMSEIRDAKDIIKMDRAETRDNVNKISQRMEENINHIDERLSRLEKVQWTPYIAGALFVADIVLRYFKH